MHSVREHPIRLRYLHLGTRPPVYVAASFTSPPWQPIEMDYVSAPSTGGDANGETELEFFKDFYVAEGHWQYKFRLGPGDWWVCNEDVKTETDNAGNRNNVLVVQPWLTPGSHEEKRARCRPLAGKELGDTHDTAWEVTAAPKDHESRAVKTSKSPRPQALSLDDAEPAEVPTEALDQGPLGKVEATSKAADENNSKPAVDRREHDSSPLFAHECLTPDDEAAEGFLHGSDHVGPGMAEQVQILDDCAVEMFPTEREHILERIETTKFRLDEDETSPDGMPSPTHLSRQATARSLPSSGQTSPELEPIEEEDVFDKAMPPAAAREDSESSGYPSVSEEQDDPTETRTKVLDRGLATLGLQDTFTEQKPTHEDHRQFAPPEVDGAADRFPISDVTSEALSPSPAASKAGALSRRHSVPGAFEEYGENSQEHKDPSHRSVTPASLASITGHKHDSLFQAFWRVVFVDWLGGILARLSLKGGDRK